jgi:hypothetical protein
MHDFYWNHFAGGVALTKATLAVRSNVDNQNYRTYISQAPPNTLCNLLRLSGQQWSGERSNSDEC